MKEPRIVSREEWLVARRQLLEREKERAALGQGGQAVRVRRPERQADPNGIIVHLNHRDVTMVAVSRAPFETLRAFKARMGWSFTWVSSFPSDFNRDYHVTFTPQQRASGALEYNYAPSNFGSPEAPGASVFYKDETGTVFHTYSCYARGLDALNAAYQWLDLVPKGRDEAALPSPMAWVRHHDKYVD